MGVYRFRPRVVAFRNDFCLTCNAERRAVQVRTFNVISLRIVPLIPVGYWKRWLCATCTWRTAYNPRSRRKFAVTLALLAAAFAAIFWGLPVDPPQADMWMLIRIVSPVVLVASTIWAIAAEGTPSDAERMANVHPATETTCPFCGGSLSPANWRCVNCGIARK